MIGDKPDQAFRFVGVESIYDKMPFRDVGIRLESSQNMDRKIEFGPCISACQGYDLTLDNIEIRDKSLGSMAAVFEFSTLCFSVIHREIRSIAFQCLDSGYFINTQGGLTLFGEFRGGNICFTNIRNLLLVFFIFFWRSQPITDSMRFQIRLFQQTSDMAC